MTQHTERTIQRIIWFRWAGEKYVVPNIQLRWGEADILLVRRSGYAEEFEIKVTKADFLADVQKTAKHEHLRQSFEAGKMGPGKLFWNSSGGNINRFSYVLPESLGIEPEDVPVYAGLYHVSEQPIKNYSALALKCVKHPPLIHKNKFEHWDAKVAASCAARYIRLLTDPKFGYVEQTG